MAPLISSVGDPNANPAKITPPAVGAPVLRAPVNPDLNPSAEPMSLPPPTPTAEAPVVAAEPSGLEDLGGVEISAAKPTKEVQSGGLEDLGGVEVSPVPAVATGGLEDLGGVEIPTAIVPAVAIIPPVKQGLDWQGALPESANGVPEGVSGSMLPPGPAEFKVVPILPPKRGAEVGQDGAPPTKFALVASEARALAEAKKKAAETARTWAAENSVLLDPKKAQDNLTAEAERDNLLIQAADDAKGTHNSDNLIGPSNTAVKFSEFAASAPNKIKDELNAMMARKAFSDDVEKNTQVLQGVVDKFNAESSAYAEMLKGAKDHYEEERKKALGAARIPQDKVLGGSQDGWLLVEGDDGSLKMRRAHPLENPDLSPMERQAIEAGIIAAPGGPNMVNAEMHQRFERTQKLRADLEQARHEYRSVVGTSATGEIEKWKERIELLESQQPEFTAGMDQKTMEAIRFTESLTQMYATGKFLGPLPDKVANPVLNKLLANPTTRSMLQSGRDLGLVGAGQGLKDGPEGVLKEGLKGAGTGMFLGALGKNPVLGYTGFSALNATERMLAGEPFESALENGAKDAAVVSIMFGALHLPGTASAVYNRTKFNVAQRAFVKSGISPEFSSELARTVVDPQGATPTQTKRSAALIRTFERSGSDPKVAAGATDLATLDGTLQQFTRTRVADELFKITGDQRVADGMTEFMFPSGRPVKVQAVLKDLGRPFGKINQFGEIVADGMRKAGGKQPGSEKPATPADISAQKLGAGGEWTPTDATGDSARPPSAPTGENGQPVSSQPLAKPALRVMGEGEPAVKVKATGQDGTVLAEVHADAENEAKAIKALRKEHPGALVQVEEIGKQGAGGREQGAGSGEQADLANQIDQSPLSEHQPPTPSLQPSSTSNVYQKMPLARVKADAKAGVHKAQEALPGRLMDEYEQRFANVLNSDNMKLLFTDEGYDPTSETSVRAFHPQASELTGKLFDRWIESKKGTGDGTVVFLAGGNGSGKSTLTGDEKASFVMDATLSSLDGAEQGIQKALNAGLVPVIKFVYRNPVDAWENGVQQRVEAGGHLTPPSVFANNHSKVRKNLDALIAKFGDRMDVRIFENNTGGDPREISLQELRAKPQYTKEEILEAINGTDPTAEAEQRRGDQGRIKETVRSRPPVAGKESRQKANDDGRATGGTAGGTRSPRTAAIDTRSAPAGKDQAGDGAVPQPETAGRPGGIPDDRYPNGTEVTVNRKKYIRKRNRWIYEKDGQKVIVRREQLIADIEATHDRTETRKANAGLKARQTAANKAVQDFIDADPILKLVMMDGGVKMRKLAPFESYTDEEAAVPKLFRGVRGAGASIDEHATNIGNNLMGDNKAYSDSDLLEKLEQSAAKAERIRADILGGRKADADIDAEAAVWLYEQMRNDAKKGFLPDAQVRAEYPEVWQSVLRDYGFNEAELKPAPVRATAADIEFVADKPEISQKETKGNEGEKKYASVKAVNPRTGQTEFIGQDEGGFQPAGERQKATETFDEKQKREAADTAALEQTPGLKPSSPLTKAWSRVDGKEIYYHAGDLTAEAESIPLYKEDGFLSVGQTIRREDIVFSKPRKAAIDTSNDAGQKPPESLQKRQEKGNEPPTAQDLGTGSEVRETGLVSGKTSAIAGRKGAGSARRAAIQTDGSAGDSQSGNSGLSDGADAVRGKRGNQPDGVKGGRSGTARGTAGSADAGRSGLPDGAGVQPGTAGLRASKGVAPQSEPDGTLRAGNEYLVRRTTVELRERIKAQKQAESIPAAAGDEQNIRDTLPMLFPEQQDDVIHNENRLVVQDKHGMLFTNGTGTGKTFSGLGIVKRFQKLGRGEILIVTPTDKKNLDWQKAAASMEIKAVALDGVQDAGKGVTITTYANFYQNRNLAKRSFDLVLYDESHKLDSSQNQGSTVYSVRHKALTKHPDFLWELARVRSDKWHALDQRVEKIAGQIEQKHFHQPIKDADPLLEQIYNSGYIQLAEIFDGAKNKRADKLQSLVRGLAIRDNGPMQAQYEDARAEVNSLESALKADPKRGKAVFLSASPFAYHVSVDYAEGYLFDYKRNDSPGYNQPSGLDEFLVSKFGYQMRNNKPNKPDAQVNIDLMERSLFEEWKKEGAVRGRQLKLDVDYSREFIDISASKQGHAINEAFALLSEKWREFPHLSGYVAENYTFHYKNYLLESMKAKAAAERARKHLAMGRQVVLFHSYKNRPKVFEDNPHPFRFTKKDATGVFGYQERKGIEEFNAEIDRFYAALPDLQTMRFNLVNPLDVFIKEFGADMVIVNGDVPKALRSKNIDRFNGKGGPKVIAVQIDAGREGIDLHDTEGDVPRALTNVGLPYKPMDVIQSEGRIYRTGSQSNAVYEYLKLGLDFEQRAFNDKISTRARTAENLAMGNLARDMEQVLKDAYQNSTAADPHGGQGTGGRVLDARVEGGEISGIEYAKTFYWAKQKRTGKTKAREGADYFATPEPVGQKMVEWAGLKPGDRALEPSAGDGAIGRWFPADTQNTFIEPSYELMTQLQLNVQGTHNRMESHPFEDLYISNKYEAVVMNPPFGSGGRTAIDHLAKAFDHLKNGGRVVALIPEGPAADKKFEQWYESDDAKDAYIAGIIHLPNCTFGRAGTAVKTRIMIVDRQLNPADAQQTRELSFENADDVAELFDRIQDIGFDPAKEPTEIKKSETGNLKSEGGKDNRYALAADNLGFYSPLEKAIDGFKQETFTADRLRGMVKNAPGVKQEELEDLGFNDWLDGVQGKVTKAQALEFIRNGGPQIEEVTRGSEGLGDRGHARDRALDLMREEFFRQIGKPIPSEIEDTFDSWYLGDISDAELKETTGIDPQNFFNRISDTEVSATEFSKYQVPGGENYREVLLTLPVKVPEMTGKFEVQQLSDGAYQVYRDGRFFGNQISANGMQDALDRAKIRYQKEGGGQFKSPHWNEPNVLAHVRLNDRHTSSDGTTYTPPQKTLFIEEIQSDWHQAGRKQGYFKNIIPAGMIVEDGNGRWKIRKVYDPAVRFDSLEEAQSYYKRNVHLNRGVPDAPFKKSWAMLAFKRVLRMAAEQGYDSVAWTPGEVQAERYDLSEHVKEIRLIRSTRDGNSPINLIATGLDGRGGIDRMVKESELPDYIGKEAAEKLLAQEWSSSENKTYGLDRTVKMKRLSGLDLKVGGEGMKGFYDQILPKEIQKHVGKMGGKVGTVEIGGQKSDDGGQPISNRQSAIGNVTVWNLPITDAMRESVMQGQSRYAIAGKGAATAGNTAPAEQLETAGADRMTIWKETGWWRGPDAMWRFEVDDSQMSLKGIEYDWDDTFNKWARLGEMVNAPELFAAYPDLAKVEVSLNIASVPQQPNRGGMYQPFVDRSGEDLTDYSEMITIKATSEAEARKFLGHEIQHAIQHKEGFVNGGNPDSADSSIAQAFYEDRVKKYTERYQKANEAVRKNPTQEAMTEFNEASNALAALSNSPRRGDYFKAYLLIPGEVEARMVERRLNMEPWQRKAEAPWQTMETMLREEGLLGDDQKPEDLFVGQRGLSRAARNAKEMDYEHGNETGALQGRDTAERPVRGERSGVLAGDGADAQRRVEAEKSSVVQRAARPGQTAYPPRIVKALGAIEVDPEQIDRDGGLQKAATGQKIVPIKSEDFDGFISIDRKTLFVATNVRGGRTYRQRIDHETFHLLEEAGGELQRLTEQMQAQVNLQSAAAQKYRSKLEELHDAVYADKYLASELCADFFSENGEVYGANLSGAFTDPKAAEQARGMLRLALAGRKKGTRTQRAKNQELGSVSDPALSGRTYNSGLPEDVLNKPIKAIDVSDAELSGSTIKELRRAAIDKTRVWWNTRPDNADLKAGILINKDTAGRLMEHIGAVQVYASLKIPEIVSSARLISSNPHIPAAPEIIQVHRMFSAIRFRGRIYPVKLLIKEHSGVKGHHAYDVEAIEVQKEWPAEQILPDGTTRELRTGSATGHIITVSQLLDGVNSANRFAMADKSGAEKLAQEEALTKSFTDIKGKYSKPSPFLTRNRMKRLEAELAGTASPAEKTAALADFAARTLPDNMRWRLKGTLTRLANDPKVGMDEFYRAALNKTRSLMDEAGALHDDPAATIVDGNVKSPVLEQLASELKALAEKTAERPRPVTEALKAEFEGEEITDPVLKKFVAGLNKEISKVRTKATVKLVESGKKVEISEKDDVERAFAALQEKTGIPFWNLYRRIFFIERDIDFDSRQTVQGVFDGMTNNKGKPAKVEDIIYNPESEDRIIRYLDTGLVPPEMTDFELETGGRIKQIYKQWEPFVKASAHKEWIRTKEMPGKGTLDQMKQGAAILAEHGEDSKQYKDWIAAQDFGVRQFYSPKQHEAQIRVMMDERREFGKGFTKKRKGPAEKKRLIGGLYSYVRKAYRVRDLEPSLEQLKALFDENTGMVDSGIVDRFFNNLYGNRIKLSKFGHVLMTAGGHFFRTLIPQSIVKWVIRNKLQVTANTLPRVWSPTDSEFWKHIRRIWSPFSGVRVGTIHRFIQKKLKAKDRFAVYFHRYVNSLDAARSEKLLLEVEQYDEVAKLGDGFWRVWDAIAKLFSWSDVDNRAQTFVYGFEAGKEALENYQKKPSDSTWNSFLNVTGMQLAPRIEQIEVASLVSQGKVEEAAYLAAHRLSDVTQFRYTRSERGLQWQEPGKDAALFLPISTYAFGMYQMLGDDFRSVNDFFKNPSKQTARRARKGMENLAAWYLVSLIIGLIYKEVWDIDQNNDYGISSLIYTPGGPVLSNFMEAADTIKSLWGADQGVGYKAALVADQGLAFYLPLYRLITKGLVPKVDTGAGTKAVQVGFKIPLEARRLIIKKISEAAGKGTPADRRRWVEMSLGQEMAKAFMDGAQTAQKQALQDLYGKWLTANEEGDSMDEAAAAEKLLHAFRKYPISSKNQFIEESGLPVARSIEDIKQMIPDIDEPYYEKKDREWGIRKKAIE